MGLDSSATVIAVNEGVRFTQAGTAVRTRQYRYTVGSFGPFTAEFDAGTDTQEVVLAAINAEVAKLASIQGGA